MSHSRENVNTTAENLINVAINLAEYSSQLQQNIESLNTFVAKKPTPQIFFYSGTVACHSTRFWNAFNSAAAKEAESKEDIPEKVTGSSHKITLVKINGHLSISPRKTIANTAQPEEHATRKDDRSLTRKSPTITIYSENGQLSLTPKKTTNATQPEEHATSKDNGSPARKSPTIKIYSDNGRLSFSPKKSTNTTLPGKDILNKVIGSPKVTKWISARQRKSTTKVLQNNEKPSHSPQKEAPGSSLGRFRKHSFRNMTFPENQSRKTTKSVGSSDSASAPRKLNDRRISSTEPHKLRRWPRKQLSPGTQPYARSKQHPSPPSPNKSDCSISKWPPEKPTINPSKHPPRSERPKRKELRADHQSHTIVRDMERRPRHEEMEE
jgi:hypothetical protein